jgi:hypothetical protein
MSTYPDWAVNRLLQFLNTARNTEGLLAPGKLKDDPRSGKSKGGYVIGETVGKRILEHRQSLPRRRYQGLEELLAVEGLGQDKLNDLVHSFNTPADTAFRNSLFQPNGPLRENWILSEHSKSAATDEAFERMIAGLDNLRLTALGLLAEKDERRYQMRTAYVASRDDAYVASYDFATWWYDFDQDNWFSFDTIRLKCETYLDHHQNPHMRFGFFYLYGLRNTPFNDLNNRNRIPFVINSAERKITVWKATLND